MTSEKKIKKEERTYNNDKNAKMEIVKKKKRKKRIYGKSISKRVFPSWRAKARELAASVTRTSYDLGL